jgi:phosphatidylserine/phosphatidylglycerophosphate/cardiolipin synthase-like enzyme
VGKKTRRVAGIFLGGLLFLLLLSALCIPHSVALPVEDVEVVTDGRYVPVALKLIREAKASIQVIMFEMAWYGQHRETPSNQLIQALIEARRRGVKVEVILETREGKDRTTERNRVTGKRLAEGGVEVYFDPPSRTTHAKTLLFDGRLALVGSTNWTYNALSDNSEVSVLIRSKEAARELGDYFSRLKASSTRFENAVEGPGFRGHGKTE